MHIGIGRTGLGTRRPVFVRSEHKQEVGVVPCDMILTTEGKRANMLAWVIPHGMHITRTPWALVGQEVLIDEQLRC